MQLSLLSLLSLSTAALAQVGGAIPKSLQAPATGGLKNATVSISRGGAAVCVSGWVNVTAATSKQNKFNFTIPANQTSTTDVFIQDITSGSPFSTQIMAGMQTINSTYEIGLTYCTPADNTKPTSVHLATHGIGFDRSYWDFAPGYSYVDVATLAGYGVLFYDRLGVGKSAKADPINELQAILESEIAASIARQLRAGAYFNQTVSKVIGVGHSFGSLISQAVTANYPTLFDAAILTGYSVNSTAMPTFLAALNLRIAREADPVRFANLPLGYLASASTVSVQYGFFRSPGFDPLVLGAATATGGSTSYGELFSLAGATSVAKNFTGPVAVVNGANDLPFCFGNCSYPTNLAAAVAPMLYPAVATNLTGTYLAPNAGHGLNLHYSAVGAYNYIISFLKARSL